MSMRKTMKAEIVAMTASIPRNEVAMSCLRLRGTRSPYPWLLLPV
jgi:hypothetical protein